EGLKDKDEFKSKIIGTREFSADDVELSSYLNHVLAWWRGKREAEGVSPGQTMRCLSCEYRNGCEWREKKAHEIDIRLGKVQENEECGFTNKATSIF
ncbi:hypothetical protein K488DRAFT_50527, partial [Vararia minispora EC-137]